MKWRATIKQSFEKKVISFLICFWNYSSKPLAGCVEQVKYGHNMHSICLLCISATYEAYIFVLRLANISIFSLVSFTHGRLGICKHHGGLWLLKIWQFPSVERRRILAQLGFSGPQRIRPQNRLARFNFSSPRGKSSFLILALKTSVNYSVKYPQFCTSEYSSRWCRTHCHPLSEGK